MRYENLLFFDKNGNSLNFDYDSTNQIWKGNAFIPKVSVGLFETFQIFVVEKMRDLNNNNIVYAFPHDLQAANTSTDNGWIFEWENQNPQEIFFFSFDPSKEKPLIQKADFITARLDYDPNQYVDSSGLLNTFVTTESILQINVALSSDEEDIYLRKMIVKDISLGFTVAEIYFYGETEGEDERLQVMTANMGYAIDKNDSIIFRDTDINEQGIDFIELNRKRKEIMLEGPNIYPYTGSYKALINAIKYFGYDNIYMKEYWQDLDPLSSNFGKYLMTQPIELLKKTASFNDTSVRVPSKSLRKTGKFGLFYKINRITGEYDEYDIPKTVEEFDYSLEEALIKLYGLKKKLQSEFLPLNARIQDITGEGDFFSKSSITTQIEKNSTVSINAGIDTDFEVTPRQLVFIEDLRTIEDLTFAKYTPYNVPQNVYVGPFDIPITVGEWVVGSSSLVGVGGFASQPVYHGPLDGGTGTDGNNLYIGDLANVLLAYFGRYAPGINTVQQLPDNENVPAGAPVVLKNTSFTEMTWDQVSSNWNQLDVISGSSLYSWNYIQYGNSSDIEWIIYKPETAESPGYYSEIRGAIQDYGQVAVILPYVGFYDVEMRIYDFYNNISSSIKLNHIEVKSKAIDFVGYYTFRKDEYTWNSEGSLSIDDYASYWDLPLEPNEGIENYTMSFESLNRANYALNNFLGTADSSVLTRQDTDELSFAGPYFWRNLSFTRWMDSGSLWWDGTAVTGDTPAFFNIMEIVRTPFEFHIVNENGDNAVDIPAQIDTLSLLADYLNYVIVDENISRYIYNPVQDEDGNILYIQAVAKYDGEYGNFIDVYGDDDAMTTSSPPMIIGRRGQSRTSNMTWNTALPLSDAKTLPRMTYLTCVYDNCQIPAKNEDSVEWTLTNNTDPNFDDIYLKSKYFTYMFKDPGEYSLEVTFQDSNQNKYTKKKNILTIK
jgi:hypothetical protein